MEIQIAGKCVYTIKLALSKYICFTSISNKQYAPLAKMHTSVVASAKAPYTTPNQSEFKSEMDAC